VKPRTHTLLMVTSFVPVILFKVVARTGPATLGQTRIAALAGVACALAQCLLSRKLTKQTTYLERAFLAFLAVATLWVFVMPEGIAMHFVTHSTSLLYIVLCLTTLLPQAFGFDPFTYAIAKQWYPESVWNTPQFRTINLHITYVWSALFLAAACSSFSGEGKPLFSILVPLILVLAIGLPFSKMYPEFYLKRKFPARPEEHALFEGTARDLISRMPLGFNSDAIPGLSATIQFLLSGEGGGDMVLSVKNGQCTFREGRESSPTLTINSSAEAWLKIARGEVDRPKALMEGLFSVQGDMALLMKMAELFRPPATDQSPERNRFEEKLDKEQSSVKGGKESMNVLAIQGSPRPKVSNTEKLLQEFLAGARSEGAAVETVYLKEKNIHPCVGCYTCWTKTPGVCVFKDDMPELLDKVRGADLLVYATPLYNYNVTALLKAFQERMLPLLDPHLVKESDTYRHPKRYSSGASGMVLVSTCGFPEVSHFDGLRQIFRHIEKSGKIPLVGELLVPSAELVLKQDFIRQKAEGIFKAAFQAGVEVVRDGAVSKETEASLQQPVVPVEELADMANIWWDSFQKDTARTSAQEKKLSQDMRLLLRGMALTFNPSAAGNLKATIQFDVTGRQPGAWFLSIGNGTCTYNEGRAPAPSLTIKTPSEVWLAIAAREKDGQQAFMRGEFKAEGDLSLLMRLNVLFGSQ